MRSHITYLIAVIAGLVIAIACNRDADTEVTSSNESNNSSESSSSSGYYENSTDYQWDSISATKIYLKGETVEIIGDGATFSDRQVLISQGGDYWITGTLTDGQIKVASANDTLVKLILANVDIACSNDAALYVEESERTIILLADSSNNTFIDGATHATAETTAAIYSKSDLAFSGSGAMTINAKQKDAITSKDGLIICSGNYTLTAVDDGIRGKDYLLIKDGTFHIYTGGDAIKSDNEESAFGYITIDNGNFTIVSKADGIQAESDLTINNGTFNINCSATQLSSKALKATNSLLIENGNFTLVSKDDAIHSDNILVINDGEFNISTNDDGLHADNSLTINYADILISKSYEGIESKTITIKGGDIILTSSDDGINAASRSQGNTLKIEGGTIVVYASGDGLDVNGSAKMTGGTVLVHGPTGNGNGPLDYDGSFVMSGGLLIASGSSGMAQMPSSSSSQKSILINFTSSFSGGTLINLQSADGTEIFTFKPSKTFQSIAISSPNIASATSYNIYKNGSTTGTNFEGLYTDGIYTPGTLYKTFTVSSTNTTVGTSSSMGGPGGR